jgi:orotidine-5'-phosphate decarboxylase
LGFDSVTVNPYLGYDSIEPFLSYSEKITFILTLTSNPGSNDFQRLMLDGEPLYMHIVKRCLNWGGVQNIGFVVGATHPAELSELRHIARNNYFLIPGIGAQGGNIGEVLEANATGPALINISRDIIYASSGDDFVEKVKERTLRYINLL